MSAFARPARSGRSSAAAITLSSPTARSAFISKQCIAAGRSMARASEIEIVDILFCEHERRSQQNVVSANLNASQAPGLQLSAPGLQRAVADGMCCVDGEIPEILRVPQNNRMRDACVHIRL